MGTEKFLPAKVIFGNQLRLYREKIGITQEEFSTIHKTDRSFIAKVENGKTAISIDLMEAYSGSFGVEYYEMGNPKFRIPPLSKMPAALHQYIAEVKEARKARKQEPRQQLADYLDPLLASDFLHTPRTGKEIADEILALYHVQTTSGKVTALLTRHPRNKTVQTIPGKEWGGKGNKYVLNTYYKKVGK